MPCCTLLLMHPLTCSADHYAARLAGLVPEDAVAALLSDQAYFYILLDIHNGVRRHHSVAVNSQSVNLQGQSLSPRGSH